VFNKNKTTLILYPNGKTGAYTIPNSVTSIGEYAFSACIGLTSVTIPNSVTSIGDDAFYSCSGLTEVTIPNSVTTIGNSAFSNCSGLTSVTIPNSVTSIGQYAFWDCIGLTSVTIPNSVTSIGNGAFYYCSGLSQVINRATTPQTIDADVFYYVTTAYAKLYVPAQSVNAYKAKGVWKNFNITSMPFTLDNASIALIAGENKTLKTAFIEEYEGDKTITWASDNSAVASVSNDGTISAKSYGTATITATTADGFNEVCIVNVKATGLHATPPARLTISNGNTALKTFDLQHNIAMNKADHGDLTYTLSTFSDNGKILTANPTLNGSVLSYTGTGKSSGEATQVITITSQNYEDINVSITFAATPKTVVTIGGLTVQNAVYDGTPKRGVSGTAAGYSGTLIYKYFGMDISDAGTTTQPTNAGDYLLTVSVPESDPDYTGFADYEFKIQKAAGTFVASSAVNANYTSTLKLNNLTLPTNYAWAAPATALKVGNNQSFAAVYTDPSGNYLGATGNIVVNVAKGNVDMSGISFANKTAKFDGLGHSIIVSGAIPNGILDINYTNNGQIQMGVYKITATFTVDTAKYNVPAPMTATLTINEDGILPIQKIQKSDGRVGIRLSKNVVSDKAEFEVILPSDKVLEVKAVIYDNTGNVVFEKTQNGAKFVWNLTNAAGRNVTNGSYLIVAEARGAKGTYAYSAKVGVKR